MKVNNPNIVNLPIVVDNLPQGKGIISKLNKLGYKHWLLSALPNNTKSYPIKIVKADSFNKTYLFEYNYENK